MNIIDVTESVIWERASFVAEKVREVIKARTEQHPIKIYGIPGGGIPCASMVIQILIHKADCIICFDPLEADVMIDDIVATGHTRDAYMQLNRVPFFSFFDGTDVSEGSYLRFPWEGKHGGIEDNITRVLQYIGEDPSRNGLLETPNRIARMYKEIFKGYKENPKEILSKTFDNEARYSEMIIVRDIDFYSMCEHHMMPFFGKAHIAYIPADQGKVVGISKLARLVDCYARRLQIQERLTMQIADAIQKNLGAAGVAVIIEGHHLCMSMRGIQKQNSVVVTSALLGVLKDATARMEFLLLKK